MKKTVLMVLVVAALVFGLWSCGEPTPTPDYVGTWASGFYTVEFSTTELTKLTYDTDARETIFTGTKGSFTEDAGVITWTETQAYSSSLGWYDHAGAGTVHTYKWSVSGTTLTLTEVVNGVDRTPLEYTKL